MSDELATYLGNLGGPIITKVSQDEIDAITKTGDWLPLLKVTTSQTGLVSEGKVPSGKLILQEGQAKFKVLGEEVEVLTIAFHARAMDTSGGTPISYYKQPSPEFQRIVQESGVRDSGCFYGPEFLVWIPSENKFALFMCGSITARKEAPAILQIMNEDQPADTYVPKPMRLLVRLVRDEAKKRSWHSFSVAPMSTPLPPLSDYFKENFQEVLNNFQNPVDSKVEKAAPAGERAR